MRTRKIPRAALDGPDESPPAGGKFGDTITDANERYTRGDRVSVSFWTGSPVNDYKRTDHFLAVERLAPPRGDWQPVRADFDWDTTCRWQQAVAGSIPKPEKDTALSSLQIAPVPRVLRPDPYQVTLTWQTDAETPTGTYRIVHFGRFKKDGQVVRFVATSRQFQIGP
jgi:neutral ceramidase